MAEKTIQCAIVSPDGPLFQGEAESVVMTLEKGETAIYPLHAPMVATLAIGEVRVNKADGSGVERFAVNRGFVQVTTTEVSVLVTKAMRPMDIDAKAIDTELTELLHAKVTTAEEESEKFDRQAWLYAQKRITQNS